MEPKPRARGFCAIARRRLVCDLKVNMEDRLAKILNSLSERINKWESESEKCIELEANFKSMESASKLAYMQAGESAVKAEAMLRATPDGLEKYKELQQANLRVERAKRSIKLAELYFDAERTNQANQRGIV